MMERSWLQISSSTPTLGTPWMNPYWFVKAVFLTDYGGGGLPMALG